MKHYTKITYEPKSSSLFRRKKRKVFLSELYNKEKEEWQIYSAMRKGASKRSIIKDEVPILYLANRQKAIDLIKAICQAQGLSDNTFFGAMYYLDIIMSKYTKGVTLKKISIIGVTCLIIALKFIQNDVYDINLSEFANSHYNYTFNQEELRHYEIKCVKLLAYNLEAVTVYDFVKAMINKGVLYNEEVKESGLAKIFFNSAKDISYSIISSFDLTWSFSAEMIGMGIIQFTRKQFGLSKRKMNDLMRRFKCSFDEDDYKECYYRIKQE